VRRELSARLEALKLQEIKRLIRSPISDQAKGSVDSAVVFTATFEGDRLVFPRPQPRKGRGDDSPCLMNVHGT
jgi:hypothetical protein